jgi:hypothetical protein
MAQRFVTEREVDAVRTVADHLDRAGDDTLFLRQLAPGCFLFVTRDAWIYDVEQLDAGWRAALGWDGKGEPEGWYRHPQSGRRRPDGDPAKEFVRR